MEDEKILFWSCEICQKAKTHAEYLWNSFSNKSHNILNEYEKITSRPLLCHLSACFFVLNHSYNKTHLSCGWVMNCPTLQNSEEIRSLKYIKQILIFQKHSYVLLNIEYTEIFSKNTDCTILQNPIEIRILKYVNHILIFQSTVTPQKYFQKH